MVLLYVLLGIVAFTAVGAASFFLFRWLSPMPGRWLQRRVLKHLEAAQAQDGSFRLEASNKPIRHYVLRYFDDTARASVGHWGKSLAIELGRAWRVLGVVGVFVGLLGLGIAGVAAMAEPGGYPIFLMALLFGAMFGTAAGAGQEFSLKKSFIRKLPSMPPKQREAALCFLAQRTDKDVHEKLLELADKSLSQADKQLLVRAGLRNTRVHLVNELLRYNHTHRLLSAADWAKELKDPNPVTQEIGLLFIATEALNAKKETGSEPEDWSETVGLLQDYVLDPEPRVAKAALRGLLRMLGGGAVTDVLRVIKAHPADEMRRYAEEHGAQLPVEELMTEAVPELHVLAEHLSKHGELEAAEHHVLGSLARMLFNSRKGRVLRELSKHNASQNEELRHLAVLAGLLQTEGDPVPLYIAELAKAPYRTRLNLYKLMEALPDARLVRPVVEALKKEKPLLPAITLGNNLTGSSVRIGEEREARYNREADAVEDVLRKIRQLQGVKKRKPELEYCTRCHKRPEVLKYAGDQYLPCEVCSRHEAVQAGVGAVVGTLGGAPMSRRGQQQGTLYIDLWDDEAGRAVPAAIDRLELYASSSLNYDLALAAVLQVQENRFGNERKVEVRRAAGIELLANSERALEVFAGRQVQPLAHFE